MIKFEKKISFNKYLNNNHNNNYDNQYFRTDSDT